jgi:hypothetical protein
MMDRRDFFISPPRSFQVPWLILNVDSLVKFEMGNATPCQQGLAGGVPKAATKW